MSVTAANGGVNILLSDNFIFWLLIIVEIVLVIGLILYVTIKLKKNNLTKNRADNLPTENQVNKPPDKPKFNRQDISEIARYQVSSKGNIKDLEIEPVIYKPGKKKAWFILSHSEIGTAHIKLELPCQDSHYVDTIGNTDWGVAVVCDGMGSKSLSHEGASFVSKTTGRKIRNLIEKEQWYKSEKLLEENEWKDYSVKILGGVYKELEIYANEKGFPLNEMGCTVIAVIYSPLGLLVTHIGDGRAGFCNFAGQWSAMMTPFNGEEANQTIAITSDIWSSKEIAYKHIESKIINEPVQAFCLMSDGCESFSYETKRWNEGAGKFEIVNRPAAVFFNPVIKHVRKTKCENSEWKKVLNDSWKKLLANGSPAIAQEPDDKTMIMGVMVDSNSMD